MEKKLLIQDLADAIAAKEGLTKKKSEAFIKALFETIEEGLLADKFVKIKGLGTFKIITVGERESVNINTGERFSIEGHERITFTPDTMIKDLVNRPFAHFQTVVINDDTNMEELESVESETEDNEEAEDNDNEQQEDKADELQPENAVPETENKKSTSVKPDASEAKDTAPVNIAETAPEVAPKVPEAEISASDAGTEEKDEPETPTVAESKDAVSAENNNEKEINEVEPLVKAEITVEDETVSETPAATADEKTVQETATDSLENKTAKEETVTISPDEPADKKVTESADKTEEARHQESVPEAPPVADEPSPSVEFDLRENTKEKEEEPRVEKEQIRYIIKESDYRRNSWRAIAIMLLLLLLLLLSYFAGYFRWFCPCELMQRFTPTATTMPPVAAPAVQVKETTPFVETDTLLAQQEQETVTDSVVQQKTVAQRVVKQEPQPKPKVSPKPEPRKVVTPKREVKPKEEPAPQKEVALKKEVIKTPKVRKEEYKKNTEPETNAYRQVKGGKYRIVGTRGTHKIERGETIRTIALDVYGSKGYAIYIITHNNLQNPDFVDPGTVLRLPQLERNK